LTDLEKDSLNSHPYGIIYKATSPSGKVYIGQTTQPFSQRKAKHKHRAEKGDRPSHFHNAIKKYGFNNFTWEEIDIAYSQSELDQKERKHIDLYKSNDRVYGYNVTSGGSSYEFPTETRQKISEAQKGAKNHNFGKHLSEKEKGKRRLAWLGEKNPCFGKVRTEQHRQRLSASRKGKMTGEQNPAAKITEEIARNMKIDFRNGMLAYEAAKKYCVSWAIAARIKNGEAWVWVAA
jgi:group I intron endonuclease